MEQKSKWKRWHKIVLAIAVVGTIGAIFAPEQPKPVTPVAEMSDSLKRDKKIKQQFSPGGMHFKLAQLVRSNMNNPASFDHVESQHYDVGDSTIVVVMTYRGTNAFNAIMTQTIRAEVDLDGNVKKIFE